MDDGNAEMRACAVQKDHVSGNEPNAIRGLGSLESLGSESDRGNNGRYRRETERREEPSCFSGVPRPFILVDIVSRSRQ